MAPKKLTEADKTSILSLYRQPQETTSTLAERYGVSNSTISRLLKSSLPEAEYGLLIQQKRGVSEKAVTVPLEASASAIASPQAQSTTVEADPQADLAGSEVVAEAADSDPISPPEAAPAKATPKAKPRNLRSKTDSKPDSVTAADPTEDSPPTAVSSTKSEESSAGPEKPARRRRLRNGAPSEAPTAEVSPAPAADLEPVPELAPESTQLSLPEPEPAEAPTKPARPVLKSAQLPPTESLEAEADLEDDDDGDDWDGPALGDDYDDDDSDDNDDDVFSWDPGDASSERLRQLGDTPHLETLEIFPLTADVLPSLCYVVVERTSSELVVLPLRSFAELGQIPEAEGDSRTLPVFENHNVARRFSRRNQRVVKVPDGTLLQTTSPYLQAKGITRLFIDGQVFSLGEDSIEPLAIAAED